MVVSFRVGTCAVAMGAALLLFAGCGGSGSVDRYELSGKLTFRGAPVPMGEILFEPAQGNGGPGAMAVISNGEYRTSPGKGTVGGPHIARITAGDGKNPSPLAPFGKLFGKGEFRMEIDIPREDSTKDLEISP